MRSIVKGLAIGSLVLLLTACVTSTTGNKREANPEKQLEVLIDLGMGYIRNQEYGRAKDKLTKALAIDRKSAPALNAFGLVYQLEGEKVLAEKYYRRAVSADRRFSNARNTYGAFLYAEKRYKEAVVQLKAALDDPLFPGRPQVFQNLGVSYLRLGNVAEAEDAFLRSVQLNPNQPRALLELAELKVQQKKYNEAASFYTRFESSQQASAKSLWLCVQISRAFDHDNKEASCGLMLKSMFSKSREYQRYESSLIK